MSLSRTCSAALPLRLLTHPSLRPCAPALGRRAYASKRKGDADARDGRGKQSGGVSTVDLVPGSQRILAGEEYHKAEAEMKDVVERFRKDVAAREMRSTGRVTPDLLAPVRVVVPESKGGDGRPRRLEECATVGVREGTTLVVTCFEENMLKFVEDAIYEAKITGVTPQKVDARTIKVPISKPTVELRTTMVSTATRKADGCRVLVRKAHQAAVKRGNYGKHAPELGELMSLEKKYMQEVGKILKDMTEAMGPVKVKGAP